MRSTGFVLAMSLAFCAAGWLIATGWRQPRPSLERSARYLRRSSTAADANASGQSQPSSLTNRIGQAALSTAIGEHGQRWTQPLRLIGRQLSTHIGLLVSASLAGLIGPALILTLLHVAGVISVGVWVPAGISLLTAVAAPAAIHSDAISRSNDTRIDLRHQLSAYLDMLTMLLAGNTGYEGALEQAARAGDGMLFRELRRRMREVGTTGHSLIGALSLVGDDFGVVELEQVAAAATLSAAEGAPVARTLAAKCSTLRSTLAAEQEANARVRNDKVTPPLVGMALLFMALIIYPALNLN